MSHYDHRFWLCGPTRYHALAKQFERDIELTHPGSVTSNRLSPYSHHGLWNTTSVIYPEHRGESV